MSELLQVLYHYALEKRVLCFLPPDEGRSLCEKEAGLLEALTEDQRLLWEQWYHAKVSSDLQYEEALFQAAFSIFQEMGGLTPPISPAAAAADPQTAPGTCCPGPWSA